MIIFPSLLPVLGYSCHVGYGFLLNGVGLKSNQALVGYSHKFYATIDPKPPKTCCFGVGHPRFSLLIHDLQARIIHSFISQGELWFVLGT